MRKLVILAAALLLATGAYGAIDNLKVGAGTEDVALVAGDVYISDAIEIDGVARCDGILSISDGAVGAPGLTFTTDTTAGLYWIGADNFGFAIAGALVGDFDATGLNNCAIGASTASTGDFTTVSASGIVDISAGAVGAPGLIITGDPDTGIYQIGADQWGIACGGALVFDIDAAGVDITGALTATSFAPTAGLVFPVGAVGAPSIAFTADPDTGLYWIGANQIGVACNGALVLDIPATGIDVTGTGTFSDVVDIPLGAVGAPSLTFTGDLDTGVYSPGADQVSLVVAGGAILDAVAAGVDVTGTLGVTGIADFADGAVGAPGIIFGADVDTGLYNIAADNFGMACNGVVVLDIAEGALDVTGNITGSGDFSYGQTPPDLHENYKERSEYITFQDTFSVGIDAAWFVIKWDETTVVGAGTNDVTTTDGWNELTTGGAGVDSESTRSWGLTNERASIPRMESVVDLTNLVTQRFEWGFWAAGTEYVMIVFDVAIGGNWLLQVDDTAGVDTIDSLVAATVDPTKLEICVDAAGNVTWAIDDVAMTVVGLTNQMTANPHYTWWELTDTAAAAHTVAVDYVQIEQLKQQ